MNSKFNNILRGSTIKDDGITLKHLSVEEFYQGQIQNSPLTFLPAYLPSLGSNLTVLGEIVLSQAVLR